jgi:hypothetical protein
VGGRDARRQLVQASGGQRYQYKPGLNNQASTGSVPFSTALSATFSYSTDGNSFSNVGPVLYHDQGLAVIHR